MTFVRGVSAPPAYRGAALVALHGSWNRSRKSGYEVVTVLLAPDGSAREEPFLTGFEVDEKVHGRPVDVAVGPDGALYVSDDFTGSIYRVAYGAAAPMPAASGGGAEATAPASEPLAGIAPAELARARERGAKRWHDSGCAACHVQPADGAPSPTYRPLGELTKKYTVSSLATFLRTPQPPMPAYPFPEEERRELAIYLLSAYP
jgi:mono/diheme cytochrome c family protein